MAFCSVTVKIRNQSVTDIVLEIRRRSPIPSRPRPNCCATLTRIRVRCLDAAGSGFWEGPLGVSGVRSVEGELLLLSSLGDNGVVDISLLLVFPPRTTFHPLRGNCRLLPIAVMVPDWLHSYYVANFQLWQVCSRSVEILGLFPLLQPVLLFFLIWHLWF